MVFLGVIFLGFVLGVSNKGLIVCVFGILGVFGDVEVLLWGCLYLNKSVLISV